MSIPLSVLLNLLAVLGVPWAPAAAPASPAAAVVTGRVVDHVSGAPLPGAQVHVAGTGQGALTNQAGTYLIALSDSWVGQEVEVVAELIGYVAVRKTITVSADGNALDFTLEASALVLDELVVTDGARSQLRLRGAPAPAAEAHRAAREGRVANNPFNTESYALIEETGFRRVADAALSTFSIDVDRASYANVRRFVTDGVRPPADAVRIEELVNYFPYADPEPEAGEAFSISAEIARAPWQPAHRLVRIGVRARSIEAEALPPSNLVFLIDVSGSMKSPDKLPLLKRSFRLLVDQLRPVDRVALVVYAGSAGLVLPPTPGDRRAEILGAIERLEAGGSTAGGEGIRLAYDVARKAHLPGGNNRVILATDGDFNVGASSDGEMVRLIEDRRGQGTFLTVLGFGTGNLKDSKMEQLADHGNGNYAYVDSELEAKKVLVGEMSGTLHTIAKDVKIQVEFNPVHVASYRLIGYENRLLADEDFNDDRKDAGELGAGHTVTALYEIVPVGADEVVRPAQVDRLRFQSGRELTARAESDELLYVKLRYKEPDGERSRLVDLSVRNADERDTPGTELRFAAAVAAWGMLLRGSGYVDGYSLADVEALARGALGADPGGYRAEFLGLVERTKAMELLAMDRR